MASIEFDGFVEPWTKTSDEHPSWGLKSAEAHRRKDEQGKYQTVARTFRTVKVSRDSGIDLTRFVKGDRVKVWGNEQTEVREHNGQKYYDLVVWADRVEPLERSGGAPAPVEEPWAANNDETPF